MERLCPPEEFCQLFQRRKHDQSQGQNIILSTGFQRNLSVIPWHSSPGSYIQHEFKPLVRGRHILSQFFFQTKETQELSAMTLPLSYGPREACRPHCYPARVVLSVSNTWHCWWWRATRDVLLESTAVPWLISPCLLIHLDVKSCVSRCPAKTEPHQLPCRLWNGEPWARCSVIAKEKEWIHRPSASSFPPRVALPEPSYCCQQNRETCLPLVWHTRWGKWNPESFLCLSSKFLKYQASSSSQSAALDW